MNMTKSGLFILYMQMPVIRSGQLWKNVIGL